MGAQWLHGQEGNPLYHLAKERDLISNPRLDSGIEGTGIFCTDSGKMLKNDNIRQIISYLFKIKDDLSENSESKTEDNQLMSAQHIFRIKFKNFIESDECPDIDTKILWSIFKWFIKFEEIDNSCDNLNDISLLSYTQYEECDGIDLINFKDGYQTVIESLIKDIPRECLLTQNSVERIEICDKTSKIKLFIKDKDHKKLIKVFDHVIISSSIGYLKKNLNTFFGFSLPQIKIDIIKALGFGTIDKIYLYFETPFWKTDDEGFQLIWTQHNHNLPVWVYDISGFDLVRGQPNVLVTWIGGKGAKQMESIESDQTVGRICGDVLRLFLPDSNVDYPSKVIRSKWATNPYICGAYSNRTLEYEALKSDIQYLYEPIVKSKQFLYLNKSIDCPLVLFSGEATDREFYSTTHGAMRSGHREAQRLIDFYRTIKPKFKL